MWANTRHIMHIVTIIIIIVIILLRVRNTCGIKIYMNSGNKRVEFAYCI